MVGTAWILIAAGLLALLSPLGAVIGIELILGVIILAVGVGTLIALPGRKNWRSTALDGILGASYVLGGATLCLAPVVRLLPMGAVLSAMFAVQGVFELFAVSRVSIGRAKRWLAGAGVASLVVAALLWWRLPLFGGWGVGTLVGINLLLFGLALRQIPARTLRT